jgi:hypothetical protein
LALTEAQLTLYCGTLARWNKGATASEVLIAIINQPDTTETTIDDLGSDSGVTRVQADEGIETFLPADSGLLPVQVSGNATGPLANETVSVATLE